MKQKVQNIRNETWFELFYTGSCQSLSTATPKYIFQVQTINKIASIS